MSQELLKKANQLSQKLMILEGNKKLLDWCNAQEVKPRESHILFTASGVDGVQITLQPETFKKVAYLLSEINERQLCEVKNEFEKCFSK